MSDHTPSAHDLIAAYMDGRNDRPHQQEDARDRATRAIAKIRADAKVEALRDLADDLAGLANIHSAASAWFTVDNIRARADSMDAS